jgi:hypothetical protein
MAEAQAAQKVVPAPCDTCPVQVRREAAEAAEEEVA